MCACVCPLLTCMQAAHKAKQLVGSPRTMTMMQSVGWKNWSTLLSTSQKVMLHIVLCGTHSKCASVCDFVFSHPQLRASLCGLAALPLQQFDSNMPTLSASCCSATARLSNVGQQKKTQLSFLIVPVLNAAPLAQGAPCVIILSHVSKPGPRIPLSEDKQRRSEERGMKCGEIKAALIDVSPGLLRRDRTSSIFQRIKVCQPGRGSTWSVSLWCAWAWGRGCAADTLNSCGMLTVNHGAGFEQLHLSGAGRPSVYSALRSICKRKRKEADSITPLST